MNIDDCVFCPVLKNPTLRACLVGYASAAGTCDGCWIGSQRAVKAGQPAVERALESRKLPPQPQPVRPTPDAKASNHVLFRALLKGPHTTRQLRELLRERLGSSHGLSTFLETLRRLGLVAVENHGDRGYRELWRWKGINQKLAR